MYSRLNIFVNKINELCLTSIDDDQVVRRILQTFLPKYKLIVSIIYNNNDIKKTIPSQVLSKITAHEMNMNMEVETPTSSGAKNFKLTSKETPCPHMKAKMRRQEQESSSSEDDGDQNEESYEEDDQSTSSNEEFDSKITKFFSKLEKNMKMINTKVDHHISIEDLINTIDHIKNEKKTKIKKRETRGRAKTLANREMGE